MSAGTTVLTRVGAEVIRWDDPEFDDPTYEVKLGNDAIEFESAAELREFCRAVLDVLP